MYNLEVTVTTDAIGITAPFDVRFTSVDAVGASVEVLVHHQLGNGIPFTC